MLASLQQSLRFDRSSFVLPKYAWLRFKRGCLPHKVGHVAGSKVSLASSVKSLEGRIRLECLRLAQVLAQKLNALLALARVHEQLAQFLLGVNRQVLFLHI